MRIIRYYIFFTIMTISVGYSQTVNYRVDNIFPFKSNHINIFGYTGSKDSLGHKFVDTTGLDVGDLGKYLVYDIGTGHWIVKDTASGGGGGGLTNPLTTDLLFDGETRSVGAEKTRANIIHSKNLYGNNYGFYDNDTTAFDFMSWSGTDSTVNFGNITPIRHYIFGSDYWDENADFKFYGAVDIEYLSFWGGVAIENVELEQDTVHLTVDGNYYNVYKQGISFLPNPIDQPLILTGYFDIGEVAGYKVNQLYSLNVFANGFGFYDPITGSANAIFYYESIDSSVNFSARALMTKHYRFGDPTAYLSNIIDIKFWGHTQAQSFSVSSDLIPIDTITSIYKSGDTLKFVVSGVHYNAVKEGIPVSGTGAMTKDAIDDTLGVNGTATEYYNRNGEWSTPAGGSSAGLFEIDINGNLRPNSTGITDNYFELDINNNIRPKP